MSICGIYKITENSSGKSYIGQSIDVWRRIKEHQECNLEGWHQRFHSNPADFSINVLEECTPTELDEKESYYIEKYNTYEDGFNLTRGNGRAPIKNVNTSEIKFFDIRPIFTKDDISRIGKALLTDSFKETVNSIINYENIDVNKYDGVSYWLNWKSSYDCFIIKILFKEKNNGGWVLKNQINIFLDLINRKELKVDSAIEEEGLKSVWYKYCTEVDNYHSPFKKLYHIKNIFGYKCKNFYYMNNNCSGDFNKDISCEYFNYIVKQ